MNSKDLLDEFSDGFEKPKKLVEKVFKAMPPYSGEATIGTFKKNEETGQVAFQADPEGPWMMVQQPGFEVEPDLSVKHDLFSTPAPAPIAPVKKTKAPAKHKEEVKYIGGVDPAMPDSKPELFYVKASREHEEKFLKEAKELSEMYNISITEERKFKVWLGIDPGKLGGMFAISEQGKVVHKSVIPLIGTDVDSKALWGIIDILKSDYDVCVILEDVHSLHKMAASTNFSMGHTLGIIQGIVVASNVRLIMVQPKAWQKEIWIGKEIEYLPKKPEQKNPSIDTKLTSKKAAHRLFPNIDFRKSDRAKNPHDGICDAACLGEYGRRKNL